MEGPSDLSRLSFLCAAETSGDEPCCICIWGFVDVKMKSAAHRYYPSQSSTPPSLIFLKIPSLQSFFFAIPRAGARLLPKRFTRVITNGPLQSFLLIIGTSLLVAFKCCRCLVTSVYHQFGVSSQKVTGISHCLYPLSNGSPG